jgi:hypothetical protein
MSDFLDYVSPEERRDRWNASPRLYIAAPLADVVRARRIADDLRHSLTIVSRWLNTAAPGSVDPVNAEARAAILRDNLADLNVATCMLVLADGEAKGMQPRATYGEAAIAVSRGLPTVWLHAPGGPGRCIFDAAPCVTRIDDPSKILEALIGRIA